MTKRSMPAVPLVNRYTLDSQPPAECASMVTGAPSVSFLTAFTASSMRFKYLQERVGFATGRTRGIAIYLGITSEDVKSWVNMHVDIVQR